MVLSINPKYLYNFTEKEKKAFYRQQHRENVDMDGYEIELFELMCSDSKDIFANYDPYPFSRLDVKYTINRLAKDDPELTHLPFGYGDPVRGNLDAVNIANAARTNTHCKFYEMADCHFTDSGAMLILTALRNKKVTIDLRGNHLTDVTFRYAIKMMQHPDNQWEKISFGKISPSKEVQQMLDKQPRITYQYTKEKLIPKLWRQFLCPQRS